MLWTSLTFRVIVQLDRSRQSGGYVLCGVGTGVPSVTKDITVGRAFPFARGQSKHRGYEPSGSWQQPERIRRVSIDVLYSKCLIFYCKVRLGVGGRPLNTGPS